MRPSCIFFPLVHPANFYSFQPGPVPWVSGEGAAPGGGRAEEPVWPPVSIMLRKKNKRKLCWIFLFGCFGVFLIYMEVLWL